MIMWHGKDTEYRRLERLSGLLPLWPLILVLGLALWLQHVSAAREGLIASITGTSDRVAASRVALTGIFDAGGEHDIRPDVRDLR